MSYDDLDTAPIGRVIVVLAVFITVPILCGIGLFATIDWVWKML